MARKKRDDWPEIEQEWAAGQLDKAEIARRYNVDRKNMRKHMQDEGIEYGSLAGSVRIKTQAKLVSDPDGDLKPQANTPGWGNSEAVEKAAERGANIVRLQRKDIAQQFERKARAEKLLDKIKIPEGDERLSLEDVQSVKVYAETLGSLVRTMGILIDKQRQAYSLDEEQGRDGKIPEVVIHDPTAI